MIQSIVLPPTLNAAIKSENKEFVVKARRTQPIKKSIFFIIFGVVWLAFISIFVFSFFSIFTEGETPDATGSSDLAFAVGFSVILGFFALIGIGILGWGIYSIVRKGGYFVGTPTRLVHFQSGTIRSIDWEQFSGDIKVSGDAQKGNISLQMRTGKMVSSQNAPARYVPDMIYMSGIPHAFEIEQVCRKRIKENDPTPPSSFRSR